MSMFYELMMRKKEEIMYATIKGTLTENNGVFSGFSASNYLEVNYTPQNINNYELGVKFTLGNSVSSTQTIIGQKSTNVHTPQLAIDSSRKLFFSFPNASHSWVSVNTTYALNIDTTYEAKMIWTGNKVYAYLKSNSVWELVGESDLVTNGWDEPILIGLDTGLNAWGGSIDLNNSYIKLGSTKYKLQAVVGYTIVGSPTIVDGVVSGFSANDYLQLPSKPDYNENFEMQVEFTKTATGNCGLCIGGTYTYGGLIVSNNTVRFVIRLDDGTSNNYALVSNNTIEINALYIANVKRVGNKIVLRIYKNGTLDEEIGEDLTNIAFSTNIGNLRLGVRVGGDALSGSMNLNNTYIKINNKLWFNGQQA